MNIEKFFFIIVCKKCKEHKPLLLLPVSMNSFAVSYSSFYEIDILNEQSLHSFINQKMELHDVLESLHSIDFMSATLRCRLAFVEQS